MFTEAQEATYKAGLARFHQNNKVVGAGIYIQHGYILTCAHVVTQCLSLGKKAQEVDVKAVTNQPVKIDFLFVPRGQFQQAVVVPSLWRLNDQDLAVLKIQDLATIPAGIAAPPIKESTYYRDHRYHVFGFPEGHSDGLESRGEFLGDQANGWIQMEDIKAQGVPIEPGFSGAPVWDVTLEGIAGITVARDKDREDAKVGFMIPYQKLKPALEAIALFELLLPEAENLTAHWQKIYHLLRSEMSTEAYPITLEDAILQVQNMSAQGSEYRAIDQLIGYLALPKLGLDIQPKLIEWLQPRVTDVNDLLKRVQQKAGQQAKPAAGLAPHLLFWIQSELNSDRYGVQAYLVPDRAEYDAVKVAGVKPLKDLAELLETAADGKISQAELEQGLQLALNESVRELTQDYNDLPTLQVEVFLPRRGLRWQVEQWAADEKTIFNPQPEPVGARYRVVLRLVERLNEKACTAQMKLLWKKKWSVLEQYPDSFAAQRLVCGNHQQPADLCSSDRLGSEDVVGWHRSQPPEPVAETDPCHFSVLIGKGSAVALWLHQALPNSAAEFAQLLDDQISELPNRVMKLRKAGYDRSDKSSPHIGEHLGLIWEDPKLVPPGTIQPSRLRISA